MDRWRHNKLLFLVLMAPALLWLTIFFLAPLASMFLLSFSEQAGLTETKLTWSFAAYGAALSPLYLKVLGHSLWLALGTTVLCLIIAYPVAMVIAFASPRYRPLLLLLVILPFWTNLLVRTYALKSVMGAEGVLNTALGVMHDMIFGGTWQPLNLLFNDASVLMGLVYVHLPFMVLPLYTALEKLDRSYLEASLDLGAGQGRTFFSVMVPLTLPAIGAGVLITFIPAFGALVTPSLLGGTDSVMIGNVIEDQFKRANNWPVGAAISLLLVYVTFAVLAAQSWFASKRAT